MSLGHRLVALVRPHPLPAISEREAAQRLRPHGSIGLVLPGDPDLLTAARPMAENQGGARDPEMLDAASNITS